jgi:uncharacterized protein YlxP (DUF503 family)
MVVAVATVALGLPETASLKDKRRIRQSLVTRLRARYNVAVAEVADQESWGRLTLGIACVSTEAGHAHAMLETVVHAIERQRLDADLLDYEIEIL